MREIKFRAWSKRANKIFYNIKIGSELMWDEYEKTHHHMNSCIDLEYMQYTGLKDKNGKEIYEGDILEYCNASGITKKEYWSPIYKVEWERFGFQLTWVGGGKSPDYPSARLNMHNDDFKIIGNIYENPELLKRHC